MKKAARLPDAAFVREREELLLLGVHSSFEGCAGSEARHHSSCDFQGFASAWVFASACSACSSFESAEADQLHVVFFRHSVCDDIDDGIDSAASVGLGQFCVCSNGFDQFSFVHEYGSLLKRVNCASFA
jgi:hypothetical protein